MTLPLPAPGNIMCQLCNLPIENQVELANHLQQDHDVYTLAYNKSKIKLQCPDCRKACAGNRNTYKLLRKHIRSAHGTDIARQCFYCGRNMNSRTSLNHHLKSSHRINPSIMKLDPIMRKYIVGGEKSGSDDATGTLRCHYCRTALPTDSELAEHLRTMHAQFASFIRISAKDNSDNYDCQRCHRVFKSVDEIQVHFVDDHGPGRRMKNKHAGEILGVFRCREDDCFWETKEEAELESHMKEKHSNVS
jgi:aspartate carbamoyltransferase regulatory subunit